MTERFYKWVLTYSISPRVCGVAWHPKDWKLNLSIVIFHRPGSLSLGTYALLPRNRLINLWLINLYVDEDN